jgi:hypothetical protein
LLVVVVDQDKLQVEVEQVDYYIHIVMRVLPVYRLMLEHMM